MNAVGTLRPPLPLDPTAAAYKDWLHVNVLDHASGAVGLVNVSLHGDPRDPRSRAVGTALVHVPAGDWYGNTEVVGVDEARVDVATIALEHVALAVRDDEVLASVQLPDDDLSLDLSATFEAPPYFADQELPHEIGWIGWAGIPRLRPRGSGRAGDVTLELATASAYHDHNWGRWHWGDDFGWEWGCFLAPEPEPAFVLSRITDRDHRSGDPALFVAYQGKRRRAFTNSSVRVVRSGTLDADPRRLPGAVAALQHDRSSPRLPAAVEVVADDGVDHVEIRFAARACAQLIAADPSRPGYSFIHELVGSFEYESRIDRSAGSGSGLAVVEHVD